MSFGNESSQSIFSQDNPAKAKINPTALTPEDISNFETKLREAKKEKNNNILNTVTAYFSWTNAGKDAEADRIFQTKKFENDLNLVRAAKDAASMQSKWLYELEEALAYLRIKDWKRAEKALVKVKNSQVISNKDLLFSINILIGKTLESQGKCIEAFQVYNEMKFFGDKVDTDTILKHITHSVINSPEYASQRELHFVADNALLTTDEQIYLLLDTYTNLLKKDEKYDVLNWNALISRIPEEKIRIQDLLTSAKYNAKFNIEKSLEYTNKAFQKSPESMHGKIWYESYLNTGSLTDLEKAAKTGDPNYICAYAKAIRKISPELAAEKLEEIRKADGNFTPAKDLSQLMEWEKGAAHQDPEAMFQLAKCYYQGTHGEEKSWDQGVKLLKEAHEKGHSEAAYELAKLFSDNEVEQRFWLHTSASIGNRNAQFDSGIHRLNHSILNGYDVSSSVFRRLDKSLYATNNHLIETTINDALDEFEKARKMGHPDAEKMIDFCHIASKAFTESNPESYYQLSKCYSESGLFNFTPSEEITKYWLEKASRAGHKEAALQLSQMNQKS